MMTKLKIGDTLRCASRDEKIPYGEPVTLVSTYPRIKMVEVESPNYHRTVFLHLSEVVTKDWRKL